MNRFVDVTRNIAVLGLGTVIHKAAGALLFITLARYVGEEGIGLYAFANSFTMIFLMIPDLGLNLLLVRAVTQNPSLASKYLGNVMVMRTALAVLAFMIVAVVTLIGFTDQTKASLVLLCAGAVFFSSLSLGFRWSFQPFRQFHIESLLLSGESIIMLGVGVLVLFLGYGLIEFTSMRVILSLLTCLAGFYMARTYVARPHFEFDRSFCRQLIVNAMPFMGAVICSTLYFNIDTILLGFFTNNAETGRYNAAYRVILMLRMIPGLFQMVTYPVLVKARNEPADEFLRITERSFRYIIIIGLGISGITLLFPDMILMIYGAEFVEAAPILQVLIFASFFYFVSNVSIGILLSGHQERTVLKMSIIALVINVVLNMVLIPWKGGMGASIAIFTSEAASLIFLLLAVKRNIKSIRFSMLFIRPLCAISVAFIPAILLRHGAPLIGIAGLAILYSLMLIFTRAIPRNDLRLAFSFMQGNR